MSKKREDSSARATDDGPCSGGLPTPGPRQRVELYATVFATGAAVMVIEILGTRVIGPVFGVSLFVWSALLAVTLGSLAAGYYAGGVVVDRNPRRELLGIVVLAAGVLLAITPAVSHAVLLRAEGLGPRGGSLLSATLLFAPCLAVLGTVGPIAVRLATHDFRATGHRVGSIYAISTAGSLIGTLVTGFLLIPALDTNHTLLGTAGLLAVVGALPLAFRKRASALAALLVPALGLAAPRPNLPAGISILDHAQSLYGLIEVLEDSNRGVRLLRADHSVIGAQFTKDRTAGFAFLHVLEALRFVRPQARDLLQIGLGIGSLPNALAPHGFKVDAVEIDPAVVRFARQYFGFSTSGEVHVEDARTLLRKTTRTYDVIVHDTFTGGATPEHLLSLEVLNRIRAVLRPGGVLALNFLGTEDGPATYAVARTLQAVFPTVRAFRDGPPDGKYAIANVVFFASDAPMDFRIPEGATFENELCERILRSFSSWETLKRVPTGPVITDRWNPLTRLQMTTAEQHFAAMNEMLPPEAWIR